jgi:recyclin-1
LQARHIDRTDFLNGAVREKKLFENALDDSVAFGLNAGTEVLMNQVHLFVSQPSDHFILTSHVQIEHTIQTRTGAREYYPVEGSTLDLQPTIGCREAIACLRTHCELLKGSTTKEVLEVFHQEIGIRLHG